MARRHRLPRAHTSGKNLVVFGLVVKASVSSGGARAPCKRRALTLLFGRHAGRPILHDTFAPNAPGPLSRGRWYD